MDIARYYTIGAVAPDIEALKRLDGGLEEAGAGEPVVFTRKRNLKLAQVALPGARVQKIEASLSRVQWFEFFSMYFSASTVSFMMGVVHAPTGIGVQVLLTIFSVLGLILYHRRPVLKKKVLGMGLPQTFAAEWEAAFEEGFALALVTVPEERFEDAQEAFLAEDLEAPLAVDRRLVL